MMNDCTVLLNKCNDLIISGWTICYNIFIDEFCMRKVAKIQCNEPSKTYFAMSFILHINLILYHIYNSFQRTQRPIYLEKFSKKIRPAYRSFKPDPFLETLQGKEISYSEGVQLKTHDYINSGKSVYTKHIGICIKVSTIHIYLCLGASIVEGNLGWLHYY